MAWEIYPRQLQWMRALVVVLIEMLSHWAWAQQHQFWRFQPFHSVITPAHFQLIQAMKSKVVRNLECLWMALLYQCDEVSGTAPQPIISDGDEIDQKANALVAMPYMSIHIGRTKSQSIPEKWNYKKWQSNCNILWSLCENKVRVIWDQMKVLSPVI